MESLVRFFPPPVFDDEEKTRAAEALNTILLMAILLSIIATLGLFLGGLSTLFIYVQRLFVVLFMLALKIPLGRGYVKQVGVGIAAGITILTTIALGATGTVRSPAVAVYILVSIIAGLSINLQAAYWSAAVNILLITGLAYGEVNGLLPPPANKTNIQQVIVFAGIAAGTVILITQALRKIQDALQRAYENEREVRSLAENLEQRVSERTADAESARVAAEASAAQAQSARTSLEAQVWLATGQTQLADAMRGEQNESQLAENILSQLCQYVGAQAGALFLLKKKTLTLAGRYALTERPGFDGKFQLGEGLVGQAAADGKVMYLENIPSDTLTISTGLADIKPRQIAAAPFYMNGKVVGVLELATLSEFTESHLELWSRISESIGAAFYTVQTRQRLADSLMASQQQAEELQAQEEELRAANEELHAQAESLRGGI